MKQTLVLLDLEETLVDNWDDFNLVNVEPVRNWLTGMKQASRDVSGVPVVFGLFSFAVWNQKDLERLKKNRVWLETSFGFEFADSVMWTLEDVLKMVETANKMKFMNQHDFFDFHGDKTLTLVTLASKHPFFKGKDVVLLDDTVSHNATFHDPKQDVRVTFKNPKNLA